MLQFRSGALLALAVVLFAASTAAAQSIDLRLNSISDSPADITLGQGNVTYTVSVYNSTGSSTATNVILTNTLPASAVYVSSTATNSGSCLDGDSGTVTCTWPTLGAFTTATATITVTPGAGGTNTFTASVAGDQTDPTPSNNSATETTTVNATIDLATNAASDAPNDITLGQGDITYTVNTYNYSSSKATNAVLTINLPASSTFVSTTSASYSCAQTSASVVTCTLATYNAFNSLSATVTVTPGAGGANTLTASIAADQGDHNTTNNSVSETSTVNATIDLAVTGLSDSPNDITLGQGNITYTVSTYNYTSSKATNAVLTINLPASSTFVNTSSATYACAQTSASVVTCTLANYNAFNSLSATVTVTPGAAGTNTLTASIAADQGDHNTANNSGSETSTVNGTIDLAVSAISDSPNDITLGQGDITYTISTYNYTSSKATNAVLTVNLPASSTFVSTTSSTWSCSQTSASVVTCTVANYNAFNSLSATVTVTPGAGGTNTLTASIAADQGDHNTANNSASEASTVNATIDLQVSSISDSPNDITLGQGNVTYSVNVYNASTSKATNTVLTVNLPASSTFVSASATSSGTCSNTSPGVVTCNWATHNAFNSFTATVMVTPGAGGTNTLTASYASSDQSDHNTANNSGSETTTVNATIDLRVSSISDSPNDITLGQGNVTYSISLYNGSTSKATNTVLTVNLPASSTFVSATATLSGTCSNSSPGVVTCNWATHNAFNSPTVTIAVTPGAGGTNTLTANYASSDQGDHDTANNSGSETTTVNATIDLRVSSISDSPNDITLGQGNVTYSISLYNGSTSKATNTVLTVNLPASSTFVSATATLSGTCSNSSPGVVTCTWATHNAFNSPTVSIAVTPGAGGTNTLSASYASSDQGDHDTANNSDSEATTVNATIDLQISGISDSPAAITLGTGNVTYTLSLYNATSSKGTNTVLTANLPASSTFVSATATLSGACSNSSPGVVTCTWANHNAFNSATVTIVVTPGAGGTNTLTASYAGDQSDHVPANNSHAEDTTVNATIDLQLTISDTPDPRVLAAGNVTYTLSIVNSTSSKATNPLVTFNLDPTTTFVSATPSTGGTCPTTGATVQCTWADIGASSSRSVSVAVTPTEARQISASGSIASDQGDHDPADNNDTETTNINPGSPPAITGFTPTSGPAGTTVTITGSNFFSSTAVKFNAVNSIFTVNNDGSITATVPGGATTGPIAITNSVGTTTSGSNFTVTPAPDLAISKTASAATVPTSSAYSYTLAVSNIGAGSANDVTVTDTLPAGVTLSSISATGWSCSGTATITCTHGALAAGANAPNITLNVTAPASGTTVVNSATVSSTTPDASSGNNTSSVSVGVVGCPSNPVVTYPNTVCANTTGHTASIAAVPSATYAWSVIAGNGTITSPPNGTSITFDAGTADPLQIQVDVMVSSCPTATTVFTVNVSTPTATITPSGPTTFCTGGEVTLTANDGASWLWSNGATTQSITVAAAGTFTVDVTNEAGCTATSSPVTVTVNNPPAATITPSGPTTFCEGGQVTLTAPAGMTSYAWSNGASTPSIVVSNTGTFTVTVTDANGCSATSAPVSVTANAEPDATITPSGPTEFCAGGSVTLNAPAGMATYSWSNGASTQSIAVNATGTFTVTVTDANGCTATSAPVNVTVDPAPPASITADGPTTFCAGGSVTLTANPGMTSYNWSNGATGSSIVVGTTGSYTVTVTDANGCTATSSPVAVTVNTPPTPTITPSGPTSFCTGGSVTLTASAGASWLWSNGATSQAITVSDPGSYSVTVTDGNGCSATSASTVVQVNNPPAASITPSGPTTFCAGGSVTLTANPGMASYAWSNGASTQSITVSSSGSFFVTVTDPNGCTATSPQTVVTVNQPQPATITPSGPTTFCPGGSVTLTASGGASWLWSTGATTQAITVDATGNYSVTVTDASGCSALSSAVPVTVNPAPVVNITGPTATCPSAPVVLDAGPGFASYAWSTGAATRTITVTANAQTTYSVTVTDGNGCPATDSHTVAISPTPAATISAPSNVCAGSNGHTASVPAQPGATYAWTITGGVIAGANDGPSVTFAAGSGTQATLGVTVTSGGCTSTGSTTVTIDPLPATPVIDAPASVDASSSGHTASVTPQPGATYVWSIANGTITAGATTPSITFSANESGPITLTVTATLNGCTSTSSREVTVVNATPNLADLAITKSAPASVQTGARFTYTLTITNSGPATSTNASVTDTLPAGVTLVSFNDGPWTCAAFANQLNCSGSPAAGSTGTITITAEAPAQPGTITNTASVSGNATPDPNAANNTASATTNVTGTTPPPCPTVAPSLVAPADNASVTSPVTMSWTGVTSATSYDLWLTTSGVTTLTNTTATAVTRSVESGTTTWYVVANLAGGCGTLTSPQRTFTIAPSTNCPTGRPTITSPLGGTQSSPVIFTWTNVPGAIGYRLWIEVDGTAAQDIGTTDGATSLTANVPPGAIAAYVDALFSGCAPTRSDPVSFTVPQPDPCANRGAATLIAPVNNALIDSSSVELQWTAAPNAGGYRVFASVDGAAPAVVGETEATSLRTTFERGEVVWFVQALYDGCAATESPRFRFVIPARNECSTAKPELVAPANHANVTDANVTFDWNAVPDAIQYEVWLGLDNGTPTLIGTTGAATTELTHLVPPGELEWFVRALIDRCPSRDSQSLRFTFTPPAACAQNERPLAVAPLNGAELTGPVDFDWNGVGASAYELHVDGALVATTTATRANAVNLGTGTHRWFVRASFGANCAPLDSVEQQLTVVPAPAACAPLAAPVISAPGQISSGVELLIQWTPVAGATSYQLQLASDEAFTSASTITTTATQHALTATSTRYARVRAVDARCTPAPNIGAYGPTSVIFVLPKTANDASAPLGSGSSVTYTLTLGSEFAGQTFTAIPTQPWLSVSPASGVVHPGGVNLTVTANTAGLPPGTSLGGITVTLNTANGRVSTTGTTTVTSPISVNLVSPVTPTPKNTPPPDALIIPAVANASGIGSHFQSDVRVSNTSAQVMKYQLSFIPTGEAGISAGRQTTFSIEPGRTVALDDILKTWFGTGTSNAIGTLEIRPLTTVAKSTTTAMTGALANLVTFASSRTFNVTPNGSFGQYIPAIPFANFIDKTQILSLQQIAQSAKYRTNLGIVEGSGESASLLIKVFGANGQKLTEFPLLLNGGQHTQLNGFLSQHGITSLDDGRVEVSVTGGNGKVTAYASVLDNATADPLLVSPVTLGQDGNTKWVVPGVADINNGAANWQTDVRIFNAGEASADLTLSFVSMSGGEPKTAAISLAPGEVKQLDRVLSMFNASQDGGALHIASSQAARLIATARTYNQTTQGTYGQFISAVTPAESAGVGSRPLQLLQVEESSRLRSNIGFAEVSGKPVTLEVSIVPPDAKFTATVRVDLAANEFRQLNSMLAGLGIGEVYNARISVRAVAGEGRATTYASVIDPKTNDPTYIPAQ